MADFGKHSETKHSLTFYGAWMTKSSSFIHTATVVGQIMSDSSIVGLPLEQCPELLRLRIHHGASVKKGALRETIAMNAT